MGELASVLDALGPALAADDLFAASNADVLARTDALITAMNQIGAELARTVRHAELTQAPEHDGLKSMGSWLRNHQRLSGHEVNTLISAGRGLAHLPLADAACTAGHVTLEQAAVLAKAVTPDKLAAAATQGIDLAEIEKALLSVAAAAPYAKLKEAVELYIDRLDPDGPEPDPTEGRSLTLSQHSDGSWTISGTLDAVGGAKVATSIESISAASRVAEDTRTAAQTRADALVQLADLALASGQLPILRTVKPHIGVLIGIDDLTDPGTGKGAATTTLGATISAARARWIACDSTVARLVIGPDSVVLDHGRDQRLASPQLRRAVELRDQTCVFAGCDAPAWWCEVHHVLHWADGGQTCLENSALLCERHHGKVHHGFRIERDPGGRWHTYRPDGTEILIGAPLLI